MKWILSAGEDIAVDTNQIQARTNYIRRVTGADVTDWQYIRINGAVDKRYLCCASDDAVDGTFITAHIGDVINLCNLRQVCESKIIIANTCIWTKMVDKNLLRRMHSTNPNVELYFAIQELSIDATRTFRQSTTLLNVGEFGFQTSLSERKLFRNRNKGFEEALKESFKKVSPIIFLGE